MPQLVPRLKSRRLGLPCLSLFLALACSISARSASACAPPRPVPRLGLPRLSLLLASDSDCIALACAPPRPAPLWLEPRQGPIRPLRLSPLRLLVPSLGLLALACARLSPLRLGLFLALIAPPRPAPPRLLPRFRLRSLRPLCSRVPRRFRSLHLSPYLSPRHRPLFLASDCAAFALRLNLCSASVRFAFQSPSLRLARSQLLLG